MGLPFLDIASGIGQASGALGAIPFNRIGQKRREERQVGYQKDLMGLQQKNQMMLNEQGRDLSMDIWNRTNYGAQVEHMKAAGLNPALMYGQAGAGGTTQGQGGGSAQGGAAPQVDNSAGMDIGTMLAMGELKSRIKLNEASAKEREALADSHRGKEGTVGAAQIADLTAGAQNKIAQSKLAALQSDYQEIANYIADKSAESAIGIAENQYEQGLQVLRSLTAQGALDEASLPDKIEQNRLLTVQLALKNKNIAANTVMTDAQSQSLIENIAIAWGNLEVNYMNAKTNEQRNQVASEANVVNYIGKQLQDDQFYAGLEVEKKKAMMQSMTQIISAGMLSIGSMGGSFGKVLGSGVKPIKGFGG